MTIAELLVEAEAAGLTVQIVNGQLFVKGPRRAAEQGRAVLDRKAEVFRHLITVPTWDQAAAIRRMAAADTVVERNGCRGAEPRVQGAAWRVYEAYRKRDMPALLAACEEVEALVKSLVPAVA
jgi:hypothetical protein